MGNYSFTYLFEISLKCHANILRGSLKSRILNILLKIDVMSFFIFQVSRKTVSQRALELNSLIDLYTVQLFERLQLTNDVIEEYGKKRF